MLQRLKKNSLNVTPLRWNCPIYLFYYKFRLVNPTPPHPPSPPPLPPPPPMERAEGIKKFDFDNPRLLEKALSGTELHWKLLLLTKKY